jgi:hypothetical protein
MRVLSVVFGFLFATAAALSIASGLLVAASFFIADRSPQGTWFVVLHMTIGAMFVAIGALLVGIAWQVTGISAIVSRLETPDADALRRRVFRLLAFLIPSGLGMCSLLALATYAILSRIDEGFAVFG